MSTPNTTKKPSKLVPIQTKVNYLDPETGDTAMARTIPPSYSSGAWPGNEYVIREWTICREGGGCYRPCNPEQIIELERKLGEWPDFFVISHKSLGFVSTPNTDTSDDT